MKGRIVCDTGPIIALNMVGKFELLEKIFDEVVVPEAVHHEIIQGGKGLPGLASYEKKSKLEVTTLRHKRRNLQF